jgi:ketosteroid isomerase-like protein
MQRVSLVLALSVLAVAPAVADDKTDVMAQVNQFTEGFNKGDVKMAVATCADQTSIIDEFPPYEWHGAGACAKWAADYDADAKKNGITPGPVTLGKPRHVDVAGDRAYVVVPTTYEFTQKGKAVKETGATLCVALQKAAAGWRIVAWTWSKGQGS